MKALLHIAAAAALIGAAQLPARAHAAAEIVSTAQDQLAVEAGKGRLIRLSRPAVTVFVADPKVADVQVKSPTLVYLVGKAAGATNLFAVDAKEQMIANIAVTVGFDEARLRDMLRREAPEARVEVASANGALVLTGTVNSAQQGDDVLRIASLFVQGDQKDAAGRIVNRLTVDQPDQVNLRVRIAEVSRDATKELGFNWQSLSDHGAQGVAGLFTGRQVLTTPTADNPVRELLRTADNAASVLFGVHALGEDLNLVIDALQQKNLVTVLAEPNLTAVSGEPANFLAGGEYPIPVPSGLGQTVVQYKQYGVSLSFVATVLEGGRISLNVKPEVSQLSNAGAISLNGITIPALTTRRAETTVDLGSGQSFAIAGLLQNNVSQDMSKLPGLGDAPIIGQLFRSKRFQRNESELVIIVTPYLVKPVSKRLATPVDRLAEAGRQPVSTASADAPAVAANPEPSKG